MSKTLFVLLKNKIKRNEKRRKRKLRRNKCQQSRNLRIPYFTSHTNGLFHLNSHPYFMTDRRSNIKKIYITISQFLHTLPYSLTHSLTLTSSLSSSSSSYYFFYFVIQLIFHILIYRKICHSKKQTSQW